MSIRNVLSLDKDVCGVCVCVCQNSWNCILKIREFQCTYILSQKIHKKEKKILSGNCARKDLSCSKLCTQLGSASELTTYFSSPGRPQGSTWSPKVNPSTKHGGYTGTKQPPGGAEILHSNIGPPSLQILNIFQNKCSSFQVVMTNHDESICAVVYNRQNVSRR